MSAVSSTAIPRALLASGPVAINATLIAVRQAAQFLCDRATLLVLLHAHTGACRYAEFGERTGLASRLVSSRLAQLCEDGLLVRIPYSRRPLRHAYHLTHMGVALFDVLALLSTWEQTWPLASQRSPAVVLEHRACGTQPGQPRKVMARLHCSACAAAIDPRDISLRVSEREMAAMPDKSTSTRRTSQEPGGKGRIATTTPLPQSLAVLGDKWSIEVLVCAFFGVHQFGDFGARIGIATNILADRLNRLVDAGLFRRTQDGDRYRKGLYLLTPKGLDFYGILIAIQSWADDWIDHRVRSPVKLRHTLCQKVLQPRLACTVCAQVMTHAQASLRIDLPRPVPSLAPGALASADGTGADTSLFASGEANFGRHGDAKRQSANIKGAVRERLRAKHR